MTWLFLMAFRDSRRSRSRLFLFMSAIVLGIAALVGINSFGENLARSIDDQARELIGADLVLSTTQPIKPALQQTFNRLGQTRSTEVSFASMVLFPGHRGAASTVSTVGGVRLGQVRGLSGGFPYYGDWETQPTNAVATYRAGAAVGLPVALVDDALLVQFGAQVGDSVKVGKVMFAVVGRVLKTPGQSAFSSSVAPTVFIPGKLVAATGLVQRGSRVMYRTYVQFAPTTDVVKLAKTLEPRLDKASVNYETVASRKQQTGRAFGDLTKYLNLVAFVALLLGCVGVASAVSLYVKEKLASVAILRCLGASGQQAFLIYLIQTSLMGLIGAVIGAVLGSAVQWLLPSVLGGFLPVDVTVALSWRSVGQGVLTGLLVSILFALLPLLTIRRVSPLLTLRGNVDADSPAGRDGWAWLIYALIGLFVMGFSWLQTSDWVVALGFTAGLLVAFLALGGLGLGLMTLVRRFFPMSWPYVWRQSLANLYRPHNQTLVLVVSIGLGAFLIGTLYQVQNILLSQVKLSASGQQPNMVLFDIQNEQQTGVEQLLASQKLPILQQVPVVTMRLVSINSRSVEAIRRDTTAKIPAWALSREYRVTYRDTLIGSEKLMAGKPPHLENGVPYISVDGDYFGRVKLKLGDTLAFNVQGALMQTIIGGTRQVDWNRVQTNFLVVFPVGVLEQAPQIHVIMTHVNDNQQSALFQRALVTRFPNVSAIDLGLILKTLDEILTKISFAIRFMALFSIITGLLVLAASVIISRYQRIRESVLLRTLGASRSQILQITFIEYALLGLLASLAGIVLTLIATYALSAFVFDAPFVPTVGPLLAIGGIVTLLTAVIGVFNSRDVLIRPPLEVLRAE